MTTTNDPEKKMATGASVLERTRCMALLLDSAPRTWTSQEEIHFRLCRALTDRGVVPVLVYANKVAPDVEERLKRAGAVIEVASYASPFRYYQALGRIFEAYPVAFVHVCFFDYFSAVPWLTRLHGITTILYEQLNGGVLRATSWRKKLIQLRSYAATYPIVRIVAVSEFIRRELVKCGIKEEKVVLRYLGVDTDRFSPDSSARQRLAAEFSIRPNEVVVSTVSVLRPIKNPQTIIEACSLLAGRGSPIRLFVGGDGEMLKDLRSLAEARGIKQITQWLGYCADPRPLLQATDIFILASIGEAFGLVLAEAMACGAAIVGSRFGAIPEIVVDGHTGLLAEPGDAGSFAQALGTLVENPELRREMGLNGLARARRLFGVDLDVANTIRIYEEVLGRGSWSE